MLKKYLNNLLKTSLKGDAREESYYKCLSDLITQYSESISKKRIDITILPKKTEAGNPDFRIWDGKQKIVGYIEAKDLGADLDKIEETEQIKRYLSTFPNVILTNFTEFRLYRDGEEIEKTSIAKPFLIRDLGTMPPVENEQNLLSLLSRFLEFSLPKTYNAKTLAVELAKRTKFLKDEIVREELKCGTKTIYQFYEVFKEYLIAGLSEEDFTDLYSQTLTYGLFAARLRAGDEFNRKLAYSFIPKSIGILRDIFKYISIEDIAPQMEIIIDDIAEVLAITDAKQILDDYYHNGKGQDPVLHFYETFLAVYDPSTREKRGVYYTPEPVVDFIVHSLHILLKEKFNKIDGLASEGVTILDLAGGTLGFPAKAIETAVEEFKNKYGEGAVKAFIKDYILQNYYSFELMMAPYAIGHMKMSFLLEELGYHMENNERMKYYLTNTLDMKELDEAKFPGMSSISFENHEAGKIKKQIPLLVILGNPPYSYDSPNKGAWISEVIKDYYKLDGKPLGEKNPKGLQDDYVKFIRFAQWKIDQAGEGVIGFITNHGYLDNPTFRGMRRSLMNSFDEIYVLDLHGNSMKKEKTPEGNKDENVFDIRVGTAVIFLIKNKSGKRNKIYHSDLWGTRGDKYDWLSENNIKTTKWKEIKPELDFYLFTPEDPKLLKSYQKFYKIKDIFPVNNIGIVTARDSLTIGWTADEIYNRVKNFVRLEPELARQTYQLGVDVRDWKVEFAQKDVRESGLTSDKVVPILYRPFDVRYTYYTGNSRGFHCMPRGEVMYHMMKENIALCVGRQAGVIGSDNYDIVFVADKIVDCNLYRRGGELVFPLYCYSGDRGKSKQPFVQMMLFEPVIQYNERKANIAAEVLEKLKTDYKKEVSPEAIFYYIYAVLYSNIFREKYKEFLKIDFPRIPFTKDFKLFTQVGKLGLLLSEIHLLKSPKIEKPKTKFPVGGSSKVEKWYYDERKVWINDEQYFEGIAESAWSYTIGGYQVCEKWLKDRKGKVLSLDEIKTYCKIVTAILKTMDIQHEIDILYPKIEETI